jgi:lipopolysaccharide/colanic/teichoic acid biosynthesis glycosyltransferase
MTMMNKGEPAILFLGDILFFYVSLWITLLLRYWQLPDSGTLGMHILPFSILFLVWLVVFFISGLYEKRTTFMKSVLPSTIFKVQIVNSVIAVLFFYFIPLFAIAPKTNLFIYLLVSLLIFAIWRVYLVNLVTPKTKQNAILIARGKEMTDLKDEINNGKYGFHIISSINLEKVESVNIKEDVIDTIYENDITTVILDTKDDTVLPLLPKLYNLMFSNIEFIDFHEVYENIFNKIPLSLVKHGWFLENVKSRPHLMYDSLKRLIDILISLPLSVIYFLVYPFVYVAIKIEDGGSIMITQERVGKDNKIINIYKFRTMTSNEDGVWVGETKNKVTKVGKFLRKSRVDEFPQLLNVFKGDISLIGPRPDMKGLKTRLVEEIPYYNVRYLIKPGLSGWAQTKQDIVPRDIEETKDRLAFDLFYIKNRSFILDLKIALKTTRTLLTRVGK